MAQSALTTFDQVLHAISDGKHRTVQEPPHCNMDGGAFPGLGTAALTLGNAQAQVVTEFGNGISVGAHPRYIAVGSDGNLWFTEQGLNGIGRITPLGAVN